MSCEEDRFRQKAHGIYQTTSIVNPYIRTSGQRLALGPKGGFQSSCSGLLRLPRLPGNLLGQGPKEKVWGKRGDLLHLALVSTIICCSRSNDYAQQ